MTVDVTNDLYDEPWNVDLDADPCPTLMWCRGDASLYRNEAHASLHRGCCLK
jgi:hypothetical protein